jgi:hypothetical protein
MKPDFPAATVDGALSISIHGANESHALVNQKVDQLVNLNNVRPLHICQRSTDGCRHLAGEHKEGMSFYRSSPPALLNPLILVELASSRIRVRSQIL